MRYFLIRNSIIENCILWDGKRTFTPGPDVQLIPEEELPGARIGDRVSGPASEQEPGAELEAELKSEPEQEPEPEPD